MGGALEEVPSKGNPNSPLAGAAASADGDSAQVDTWSALPLALANSHPVSQHADVVVPDGSQARVPFPFFDAEQLASHVFPGRSDFGSEEPSLNISHSSGRSSSLGGQAAAPAPWTA